MHRPGLPPLLLLALVGCDVDNDLNTKKEAYDDVPLMVVEPGQLDFGGLGTDVLTLTQS